MLDGDESNRLVHHYSHVDRKHQTTNERWGGAFAIGQELTGLSRNMQVNANMSNQHRWRAWVARTQASEQPVDRAFAMAVVAQTQVQQSAGERRTTVFELATHRQNSFSESP